jgi:mannose-1-phosphate guanylyltransferase / phosphomannomutase
VAASRDSGAACRMIKRALITGLISAGVDAADLRVIPAPVTRRVLKVEGFDAGVHVGSHPANPEIVRIQFYEPPGVEISSALEKEVEKHFSRQELRRMAYDEVGSISYPARVRESYAQDLLRTLDVTTIRSRGFRIVVDYGYSAASYVLPLVLGPLGVEAVSAHGFSGDREERPATREESVGQARRLVGAIGADLGAVFDRAAERLYLIDERGQEVPSDRALLLFLRLIAVDGRAGRLAFPVTVTRQVDEIAAESGLEVVRTRASLADLTRAAATNGVVFAGALSGGYVFPRFLPAYDAVASLCNLLELLAPGDRPLSQLVADLPSSTIIHREMPCPWALKGTVMRVLNERFQERETDLTDGIKVFDPRGSAQVLPDADEPLLHVYAEGATAEESEQLAAELRAVVEEIFAAEGFEARA